MKFTDIINEIRVMSVGDCVSEKQFKKAKLLYTTFKTGKFTIEDGGETYRYELPDEFFISMDDGNLCIILTMNPTEYMKMYFVGKNGRGETIEKYIDRGLRPALYRWMKGQIKGKFEQFGITFIF